MTPYTLTVDEAETQQLRELVMRTRTTHRPILLTSAETSEPIAVLLESHIFEKLQRQERHLFQLQLRQLLQQIEVVEAQWADKAARREFIDTFPANTHTLWRICPEQEQDLCVTLDLAAHRLSAERLTQQQLAALHHCIRLLQTGSLGEPELASCERRLIEAGLPPILNGSESLVQLYMGEL